MSDCKRSMKAVVLDDGTASFWRADGADIRHAQGVTGVVATEVLDKRNTVRPNSHAGDRWENNLFIVNGF